MTDKDLGHASNSGSPSQNPSTGADFEPVASHADRPRAGEIWTIAFMSVCTEDVFVLKPRTGWLWRLVWGDRRAWWCVGADSLSPIVVFEDYFLWRRKGGAR